MCCHKKRFTWGIAPGHSRCRIKYSRIFYIRSAVAQVARYSKTDRDGDPNVFNLNSNGDQLELNGNNARFDNKWNSGNRFVFRSRKSFLFPRLSEIAVFSFEIIQTVFPSTKHFSYFIQIERDFFILLIGNKFSLPGNME